MIQNPSPKSPQSLRALKRLGDKRMADAHQAVADSQRLAHSMAEMRAETKRLHDRFHGPTSELTIVQ